MNWRLSESTKWNGEISLVKLLQKRFLLKGGTNRQISVATKSYLSVKDALLRFENLLVIQLTHSKQDALFLTNFMSWKKCPTGVNCNFVWETTKSTLRKIPIFFATAFTFSSSATQISYASSGFRLNRLSNNILILCSNFVRSNQGIYFTSVATGFPL